MESLKMWSYWRDYKGMIRALTEYFPEPLAGNAELQHAVQQINFAARTIDTIMCGLEDRAENEGEE